MSEVSLHLYLVGQTLKDITTIKYLGGELWLDFVL